MVFNLCGDVERDARPSTDDLLQQLGVSPGTRLDAVTAEMQSMSSAISTVPMQLNPMKDQLLKRQKGISAVKKQTDKLEEKLVRVEKEQERQRVFAWRDNVVFYRIPEVVHDREFEDDCARTLVNILNSHDTGNKWTVDHAEQAHRLGRKEEG